MGAAVFGKARCEVALYIVKEVSGLTGSLYYYRLEAVK